MRFALVYIFGFCAAVPAVAEVSPLGGDVIGPDSSTTDGRGAFRAGRFVPEDVYHGLPGVVFSLSGRERLRSLRAIVTFTARPTGKIQVPNHRFRARLWTLQDYLSQQPPLDDIELGLPDDIEFTTAADGSTVPARTFGQAGGNIPAGVPSYDFRWELSSRAAFDSPLPAGEYVLALYSQADALADGELHVGMTHGFGGLPAVFFANAGRSYGPDYAYPCLFSDPCLSWAITLEVENESPCEELRECEECTCCEECLAFGGGSGGGGLVSALTGGAGIFGGFGSGFGSISPGLGFSSPGGGGAPSFGSGVSSSPPFPPDLPEFDFDVSTEPPGFPPPPGPPPDDPPPPSATPMPEPGSFVLLGLGVLMLLALSRYRNRLVP